MFIGLEDIWAPEGSDRKQRWLNMHAYAARIFGLGLAPFEAFAIWTLTDAVEGVMIPVRGSPDLVSRDPSTIEDLPFKAAAAAAWIKYSGTSLYGRDEPVPGTDRGPLWRLRKKEAIKPRRKFKGTQGLCLERWLLWKAQFGEIGRCDSVDGHIQTLAKETVALMDKIE